MKRIGLAALALYVLVIYLANYAVNHYGVVSVGFGLVAPAGVYFAGLAFTLRDVTQATLGKLAVIAAILGGAVLSMLLGADATIPGGHVSIAVASGVAFLASELADFAVYTPIRQRGWLPAVIASNVVGAVLDSLLFLYLAFGSTGFWKGQVVGKLWMTALAVVALALIRWTLRERGEAVEVV